MKLNLFVIPLLAVGVGLLPAATMAADAAQVGTVAMKAPAQEVAPAPAGHLTSQEPVDLIAQALDDYKIGPADLIEISVFQVPELSKTVRVGVSGTVTLPLIGQLRAIGLTGQELEVLIARKLSENYLQDPQVSVFIKEYISQRVTVEGSVNRPGVFPISGKTTLLQTIAMAGGLDKLADSADIKVFRDRKDGSREILQYDIDPIRKGEVADPTLSTNDLVVVGQSGARSTLKAITETLRDISVFGLLF